MEIKNNNGRVVLNCLPPAHTLMPSALLNILKCVLKQHGFLSEVIYWNNKFEKDIGEWGNLFGNNNYEFSRLIPFVYDLSKDFKDKTSISKIFRFINKAIKRLPHDKNFEANKKYVLALPEKTCGKISSIINEEFLNFDFTGVILSGFTSKFYQWLPALRIAGETKRLHPEIKTVIGGFDSKSEAVEMLRNFSCFDFAVWGEGEYPLLELCNALKENQRNFAEIPGLAYREDEQILCSQKAGRKYLNLDNYPEPDFDDFFSIVKEIRKSGFSLFTPSKLSGDVPGTNASSAHWQAVTNIGNGMLTAL